MTQNCVPLLQTNKQMADSSPLILLLILYQGNKNMFSDKHYPPSFLTGNKSIRDMLKNPEEYDRRMEEIDKRRLDLQKERESREANMHRLVDERSKYLYTPPPR